MKIDSSRTKEAYMSELDLARLGGGEVAYIKMLTYDEAHQLFPQVEGVPKGIPLFSLHAADGEALALTDTLQAAMSHARDDELTIATLH